jgi:predicted metallo-beta-lactamase superfamily hydrolase
MAAEQIAALRIEADFLRRTNNTLEANKGEILQRDEVDALATYNMEEERECARKGEYLDADHHAKRQKYWREKRNQLIEAKEQSDAK